MWLSMYHSGRYVLELDVSEPSFEKHLIGFFFVFFCFFFFFCFCFFVCDCYDDILLLIVIVIIGYCCYCYDCYDFLILILNECFFRCKS